MAETNTRKKIVEKTMLPDPMDLQSKKGRHWFGQGLFLRVLGEGKSYWVYRYRFNNLDREFSIGPYPEFSLKDAERKHIELRKRVIVDKVDPLAERIKAKEERRASGGPPTFGEMAEQYLEAKDAEWKSASHRRAWRMTLTEYCDPIRSTPVDKIDTAAVLKVLKPLWGKTPETASRLRARIEAVLDRARVLGHIDQNFANPARWKGHLKEVLANPRKVGERKHLAAIPYAEVPTFMARLGDDGEQAAKALAFTILTAARSGETLGATWDEIDLVTQLWSIPKERMKKGGRPHRVPLSAPALAILKRQEEQRGKNPYVFPGMIPRRPMAGMTLARAMQRHGAGNLTVHGFRSAFRDWAGDETNSPREVAEAALAHAVGNQTEAAYRRADALEKRRDLMAAWGDYCVPSEAKVVPITSRADDAGKEHAHVRRTGKMRDRKLLASIKRPVIADNPAEVREEAASALTPTPVAGRPHTFDDSQAFSKR
jgi:integrase